MEDRRKRVVVVFIGEGAADREERARSLTGNGGGPSQFYLLLRDRFWPRRNGCKMVRTIRVNAPVSFTYDRPYMAEGTTNYSLHFFLFSYH
jgi:hypothetical protein